MLFVRRKLKLCPTQILSVRNPLRVGRCDKRGLLGTTKLEYRWKPVCIIKKTDIAAIEAYSFVAFWKGFRTGILKSDTQSPLVTRCSHGQVTSRSGLNCSKNTQHSPAGELFRNKPSYIVVMTYNKFLFIGNQLSRSNILRHLCRADISNKNRNGRREMDIGSEYYYKLAQTWSELQLATKRRKLYNDDAMNESIIVMWA